MPELTIRVGGRPYQVACQDGEERFLESAAALLDRQATHLTDQIGNLPENRLLLMAGLMVADQMAAVKDGGAVPVVDTARVDALTAEVADLKARLSSQAADLENAQLDAMVKEEECAAAQSELTDVQAQLETLKTATPAEAPEVSLDTLEELTTRAESLAQRVEGA